ncbi:restriction endonuclease subunit S [Vibrio navarrensis]
MGSNTVRCKLGDVATFRNGAGVKQDFFTTSNDGVNLAKVSNFTSDSIDLTDATKVDREHAQKWTSHLLKSDDVLIATVGSWPPNWSSVVGKVVRAPKGSEGAIQNQNTCCVIPNQAIDQSYLYYLLKTRQFSEWIVNVAQGSANQARVPVKKIGDFEFELPPIDIQRGVASTLRNLDNKITLNRQINQTLEQMAQTLFKSWFVDFDPVIDNALDAGFFEQDWPIPDELRHRAEARKAVRESEGFKPLPDDVRQLFPDAFEESELGWVPKGWAVKKISDFGSVICGKTPSKKIPEYYGSDVPFLKIPDMHGNVFVVKTTDKLSYKGSNSQVKKLIPKDSISVSCIATVGLVSISTEPMHTNQQINSIVPNQPRFRDYLYFSMKEKRKQFHDLASGGSTTLNMNTGVFSRVSVLKPSDAILDMFQTQSCGLLERIKLSSTESESLAALRDTLLPKLISGELRLDDVEAAVEQETVSA